MHSDDDKCDDDDDDDILAIFCVRGLAMHVVQCFLFYSTYMQENGKNCVTGNICPGLYIYKYIYIQEKLYIYI